MIRFIRGKWRQGSGKVRRFLLARVRKTYIQRKLSHRHGECIRCGTCCKLLFHCPYLEELPDGGTSCKIHEKRPRNCRVFPVDHRDLLDRDTVMPELPCGFTFSGEETTEQ